MSRLIIDTATDPLETEPRNGDPVAFLVEGIVRRVEDDLIGISQYQPDGRREYTHGSREIEVTVTRLLRQPVPVEYA